MRNIAQVPNKAGTKPASVQTKTSRRAKAPAAHGRPASVKKTHDVDLPSGGGVISFFTQGADEFLTSIPVSAAQLAGLNRRAACGASSLESYIQQGFGRMLDELEGKLDVRAKAELVNEAAEQSSVLLELISTHLDAREHRRGEVFTGERADKFNFGLDLLVCETTARLQKAAGEMMAAAYGWKPEVAS